MARWLAVYVDRVSRIRAAMIKPAAAGDMPFGVDEFELGLEAFDGESVTYIEMPDDEKFRPIVVDNQGGSRGDEIEVPLQFIDL